jgi:DNA-binding XRE family transcriptional regulator
MKYPKLKAKRVELGYTQLDMANKMGITLATYNLKEQGKREFLGSEILQLLNILKCNYEDIFLK